MTRTLLISLTALTLAACGFKPMYGQRAESPAVTQALASVEVAPIEDRLGQLVRTALSDRLTPGGGPNSPRYTLKVSVIEEREDVGIRQDASITRANYRLSAKFDLVEVESDTVLITGTTWSQTAFDVVQQDFATVTAEQDAQRRLAGEVADEIAARLAIYFDREQ
ncbi:MAG: LPS assembly lipoprotein LptE [Alphaproteobacteria bacterium]